MYNIMCVKIIVMEDLKLFDFVTLEVQNKIIHDQCVMLILPSSFFLIYYKLIFKSPIHCLPIIIM